jgi:hypothetical protein
LEAVVFARNASLPVATLELPVVLLVRELQPLATL